ILERIVPLSKWHRAGVEPRINYFRDALHVARAAGARALPRVAVDVRLVWIELIVQPATGAIRELGEAADDLDVRVVLQTEPYRERRSPVPIARNRPIDVVLQPIAEASFTHLRRIPVDGGVPREHRISIGSGAHEPRCPGVVQERRVATPAVRIRVHDAARLPEHAATLELLDQEGVGVLDEESTDDGDVARKLAAAVHGLEEGEVVPLARGVIVGTERR